MSVGDYSLFGLRVRSEIPLPEAISAEGAAEPDVTVGLGQIAETSRGTGLHVLGGTFILEVPKVARYRVEGGHSIIVEPAPGAAEQNVRLFLLGSTFGLLLHQRGLLPLHANAIEIDGKAFAFMGRSGAGKSTLAAWFQDHGHRVIGDDVCVVQFGDDGSPSVRPGVARLRLWREAVEATGRSVTDYEPSFIADNAPDKFDVPLTHRVPGGAAVPLAAVYLLESAETSRIEALSGVAAVQAAFENTYRGQYIASVGSSPMHWDACVRLVRTTPIFRAERLWGLDRFDTESALLLQHARGIAV